MCLSSDWIRSLIITHGRLTGRPAKFIIEVCKGSYGNVILHWQVIATRIHNVDTEPCRWWRHQMKIFAALLALCAGNSPLIGEFPTQRPVTRSFDVFFDLRLNKRLTKQSPGWWLEMPSRSLWRHRNGLIYIHVSNAEYKSDNYVSRTMDCQTNP